MENTEKKSDNTALGNNGIEIEIAALKMEIAALSETVSNLTQNIKEKAFNSSFCSGADGFRTKCQEFSSLFYGDELLGVEAPKDIESFLFFTDPHLIMGTDWENMCREYVSQIQKYYNSTPTTFCLCGGDWLGSYDLPEEACFKLGYVDGFMRGMFNKCYMILGNHDTNYQGKKDPESDAWTTKLSKQANINLWYRREGKTYFAFDGARTKFYCFDTGAENEPLSARENYGLEQALWFADSLKDGTDRHIAIALHILYPFKPENGIQPLAGKLLDIAEAYNARKTVEVGDRSFDFGEACGKVKFLIAGHGHRDCNYVINGIPCIECVHTMASLENATFDLVFADYSNRVLRFIRVGYGENRTIPLD